MQDFVVDLDWIWSNGVSILITRPIDFVLKAWLGDKGPIVISECFDIVQVGYDIINNFDWENFEFLEIHRCPEGVEIWSKQFIFEF